MPNRIGVKIAFGLKGGDEENRPSAPLESNSLAKTPFLEVVCEPKRIFFCAIGID